MAIEEKLAERIRAALADHSFEEKKMFGGLTFMVDGHMCCGVGKEGLMVRVGPEAYESSVKEPGARPMDFTGRQMKGLVWVDPDAVTSKRTLTKWVNKGIAFVNTLPKRTRRK